MSGFHPWHRFPKKKTRLRASRPATPARSSDTAPEEMQRGWRHWLHSWIGRPFHYLEITAAIVALLFVAQYAIVLSLEDFVLIQEVEIAEELQKKGITPARVQLMVQESLNRLVEQSNMDFEKTDRELAARKGFLLGALGEDVPSEKFAKYLSGDLSIGVLSQRFSLDRMAYRLASMLSWGRRQYFLTLRVAATPEDQVNVLAAVQKNDAVEVFKVLKGPASELLETNSGLLDALSIQVLEGTAPELAVGARQYLDNQICSCIRLETLLKVETSFDQISPFQLAFLLGRLVQDDWRLDDSPEKLELAREALDRLLKRAEYRYPDGPFRLFRTRYSGPSVPPPPKEGECLALKSQLTALVRTASERRINEYVAPVAVVYCLSRLDDKPGIAQVQKDGLEGASKKWSEIAKYWIPVMAAVYGDRPRMSEEEYASRVQAALGPIIRTPSLEGQRFARQLSVVVTSNVEEVLSFGELELATTPSRRCEKRDDFECQMAPTFAHAEGLKSAGLALIRLKEHYEKAEDLCRFASALTPSDAEAAQCLGQAIAQQGRGREGLRWWEEAHRRLAEREVSDPIPALKRLGQGDIFDLRFEIAALRAQLGDHAEAEKILRATLKFDPASPRSSGLLQSLMADQCDEEHFEELVKNEPVSVLEEHLRLVLKARKMMEAGQFRKAREIARDLVQRDRDAAESLAPTVPDHVKHNAHLLLGMAYLADGKSEAAQESLLAALKIAPANAEAQAAYAAATNVMGPGQARWKKVCKPAKWRYGA